MGTKLDKIDEKNYGTYKIVSLVGHCIHCGKPLASPYRARINLNPEDNNG